MLLLDPKKGNSLLYNYTQNFLGFSDNDNLKSHFGFGVFTSTNLFSSLTQTKMDTFYSASHYTPTGKQNCLRDMRGWIRFYWLVRNIVTVWQVYIEFGLQIKCQVSFLIQYSWIAGALRLIAVFPPALKNHTKGGKYSKLWFKWRKKTKSTFRVKDGPFLFLFFLLLCEYYDQEQIKRPFIDLAMERQEHTSIQLLFLFNFPCQTK